MALVGKVGVKVSLESYKIIVTKKMFLGEGLIKKGLFVLNVNDNSNCSISSAYLIDSLNI